jgi:putative peptidoglycan lipid II flippase
LRPNAKSQRNSQRRAAEASGASFDEKEEAKKKERFSVVIGAFIFAIGILASRVLGLFRDMLTARYFSADVRDALLNAFRLPNLFRRIFGEGSLSVSFIPVFVDILTHQPAGEQASEKRARVLVAGVFSILLSITLTVSFLAIVFMEDLMSLLLNGHAYMAVPGKLELTVYLGRIMFGFLVLISLYGYFMAILSALKKFAAAAIAPCFFNLSMIAAALVSPQFAAPETVLAISVIVGGILQMAVLVPGVIKSGYFPRFTLPWSSQWSSPDVARVIKTILPSVFGVSMLQITALVNMRFAAELPSGSHSYLYLADRILELPLSLFVVSISSALLPTLARYWSEKNKEAMADTINHYIRLIAFVALPAAIGMFVLARPITEVLFLGRQFKYQDALATASLIRIYAFAVVVSAGVRILAQGFYAIQNTWFPALAGAVALIAHLLFAYSLTNAFGLEGLATASVGSALVNLLMLATAYNEWVGSLQFKAFLRSFMRFAICGALMVAALQLYEPLFPLIAGKFRGSRAVVLFVVSTFGAGVYFLAGRFLRVEEFEETVAAFRARLSR